jgi:hypothetical protein
MEAVSDRLTNQCRGEPRNETNFSRGRNRNETQRLYQHAAQSFAGAKMPNIQEFRERAEECHRLAAAVSDPRAKAFWVRSAEDWMNVASASEKLANRPGDREAA